jgi:histidinol-phosphate aminotransferase
LIDFSKLVTIGVRDLQPYLPGKPSEEVERELGLTDVVKLASNESPLGPGPKAREAIARAAQDVSRYPDANGFYLKQRLSELHGVTPDRLTLGNGSNDVLDLVARCFAGPGAEVIYSEHAFVVFGLAANAVSATPVVVPATGWGHDLGAMADAVTERTRLVFIANPNNPTGTWNTGEELERFVASVPERVIVVIDQAYAEYVARDDYPDCVSWVARYPNVVVTRTFSKVHGLAALRVGYAVSAAPVADYMNRVRHPFNVNSLGLAGALAALDDAEHVAASVALNREGMLYVTRAFDNLGLEHIPSIGNFVTVDVGRSGAEVFEALLQKGVIVRPVANYGMLNHLRISIGLAQENHRCLEALSEVLGAK